MNELTQVTDHLGGFVQYQYDAQGSLARATQGGPAVTSAVTSITPDLLGRKTAMTDPDMGTWTYSYNAFGELIKQTNALSEYSDVRYDLLGRMTQRTDKISGGAIETDSAWLYDAGTHALGKLIQEDSIPGGVGSPSISRTFTYDNFGRPAGATTTIGTNVYATSTTYDSHGRLFQRFDGAGNFAGVEYGYNSNGYLEAAYETRGSLTSTHEFYRIEALDARGQVTELRKGGITVIRDYDPSTGRLQGVTGTTVTLQTVQDLLFTFDEAGNLTSKTDVRRNLGESYFYDDLNRLTSVTGNSSSSMSYDALGNLASKTGTGSYTYGGKPHAATNVGGVPYTYNANGSLTGGDGRTIGYTVFNKPDYLARSATTTTVDHDPNRERFRRIDTIAGSVTTRHYVGSIEKIWRPGGLIETKRAIDGELIVTERSNGTSDERFLLNDHLGSIDVITNESGTIVQEQGFDAWGWRRGPNTYVPLTLPQVTAFDTSITTRGFTEHEEIDPLALTHMNGRVYEPKLGRFVSADPFVPDPHDTQSLNRLSYVTNNPLSYTDPSGYGGGVLESFILGSLLLSGTNQARIELQKARGSVALIKLVIPTLPGGTGGVFGNGSSSSTTTGPSEIPVFGGCSAAGVCHLDGEGDEDIRNRSLGGTGSEETGGKFENGTETLSYWGVGLDIFLAAVPGGDIIRCSTYDTCDRTELALAAVGVLPSPAKAAVLATKVTAVAIAIRKIQKAEHELKRALEVDKTIGDAARGAGGLADDLVVVRGGVSEVPPPGQVFSGAYGRTLEEAASGVPHGQIRATTVGQIRAGGGAVDVAPELTRSGVLNERHVNICLGNGPCPFGPLQPNPVPKSGRIQ